MGKPVGLSACSAVALNRGSKHNSRTWVVLLRFIRHSQSITKEITKDQVLRRLSIASTSKKLSLGNKTNNWTCRGLCDMGSYEAGIMPDIKIARFSKLQGNEIEKQVLVNIQ